MTRRSPRLRLPDRYGTAPLRRRASDRGRTVLAVAIGAVLLLPLVPTGPVLAQAPQLSVSPNAAPAGTTVTAAGVGFEPGATVQLTWDGATAGMPKGTVRGNGRFSLKLQVPAVPAGPHTLAAMGTTGGRGSRASTVTQLLAAVTFSVAALATPSPTASATLLPTPTPTPTPTPAPTAAPSVQPTATPPPNPTTAPSASFVTRQGTTLLLDGRPYRFTGLNIYNANSRDNCWYPLGYDTSALGAALDAIGPGQEVFRAWFFQGLATTSGQRDWSAFDRTLAAARARGTRVIVTLADQWGACDSGPGGAVFKTDAWYRDGYRTEVVPGNARPYRDWVAEIVTRYRDDPTILAWQLMNEAEVKPSLTGTCTPDGAAILKTWAADVAGLVKSIDRNHLVSLGTLGGGQCGTQHAEYAWVHDLQAIDLCEFHDYEAGAMPGDQWNGLAFRLEQCAALGKPLFVGEVGMRNMTLDARAQALDEKWRTQFGNGVAGALAWAFRDAAHGGSDPANYDIGPGDPVLDVVRRY